MDIRKVRRHYATKPALVYLVLMSVVVLWSLWFSLSSGLVPQNIMIMACMAVLVLLIAIWVTALKAKRAFLRIAAGVVLFVMAAVGVYSVIAMKSGLDFIKNFTSRRQHAVHISVIVAEQSAIKTIDDVKHKPLHVVPADKKYNDDIQGQVGAASLVDALSYVELAGKVQSDDSVIVLVNESYRAVIEEAHPDFAKKTRIIKTFTFTEEASESVTIDHNKTFSIYISGIDTYGPLATVSRSDVNMVLTANPKTKKLLITSVPRDAYVRIPGGGQNQKDKLTHAGIYGVDASIGALEGVLNTKIDGYVRINFTSFIKLVDAIGGVTVQNPRAFTSYDGKQFAAGTVRLNGKDALSYSRERKSLGAGDVDRGKNQMRVVEAIIDTLMSPAILANYQSVMGVLGQSMQTNLSQETVTKLINQQLGDGGSWTIENYSVRGRGQTGGLPSFAMPGYQLYMYVLDDGSLAEIRQKIKEVGR